MVAAAEIYPFEAMQIFSKLLLKGPCGGFQVVGILFAQGMEVQSIQQREQRLVKVCKGGAQPGAGGAGVIDGVALLGGALRVDPQADRFARILCPLTILAQLVGGVKDKVVGVLQ